MSAEEKKKKGSVKGPIVFAVLGFLARLALFLVCRLTIKADEKVKEWKKSYKGFIILSAHPSEMDGVVLIAACFPRYSRFVVGSQQIYRGAQGLMLRTLGVIPKKQFTPDIASVKEMLRTVKDGKILAMMPEGRVSLDGRPSPIDPSTAKLLQKLGCPVAVLVPEGSYYTRPPYNHGAVIRGKIVCRIEALFDEGEAAALSSDEVMNRLYDAIYYDAAEELRGTGRLYGSASKPPMKNVSNLLYYCPSCGAMYTVSDKDGVISCSSCGMTLYAGRDMFFSGQTKPGLPDNVTDWNAMQIAREHAFWQSDDPFLEFKVKKMTMVIGEDMEFKGDAEGLLRLDPEGLHYSDEGDELDIRLSILPGVSADYRDGFIACYQGDLIRRFYFEDKRTVARFVNSLMVLKGLR